MYHPYTWQESPHVDWTCGVLVGYLRIACGVLVGYLFLAALSNHQSAGYANICSWEPNHLLGVSHTVSYDGAAAYWAQQNAQQKANDFDNEQYVIRNRLTAGYGKANTIRNQEEYAGYFNIKYQKTNNLMISFNIILMGKFLISHIFGKNLLNSKDIMQSRKQLLYLLDNFFQFFEWFGEYFL